MTNEPSSVVVPGLSALSFDVAFAQGGATAEHGGGVAIDVADDRNPRAPSGLSGQQTVLDGTGQSRAEPTATADKPAAGEATTVRLRVP